jgi:hypothetical protein
MKTTMFLLASAIVAGTAMVTVETATAQGMPGQMRPGMMQGGAGTAPPDHGTMQGGMDGGKMCPMMRSGMMRGGMMQGGRTGGMMRGGMMGMMGSGMMSGGMGTLFGSRVRPVMNLSVDDVRGYLALRLDRLNNKRLKLGDIKSADGAITADIVTVDNSLVQRLKVDPHTGAITYEN